MSYSASSLDALGLRAIPDVLSMKNLQLAYVTKRILNVATDATGDYVGSNVPLKVNVTSTRGSGVGLQMRTQLTLRLVVNMIKIVLITIYRYLPWWGVAGSSAKMMKARVTATMEQQQLIGVGRKWKGGQMITIALEESDVLIQEIQTMRSAMFFVIMMQLVREILQNTTIGTTIPKSTFPSASHNVCTQTQQ